MITSICIIATSALLFAYWFRYTCLLILSAKTTKDYAGEVAAANQLYFPEVQQRLADQAVPALGALRECLDHDYAVVTYLLRHAATFQVAGSTLEQLMLKIDYQMMSLWYSLGGSLSAKQSRRALEEMATIVAHFANSMGEATATGQI